MIKNNWIYPVICLASLNALLLGQAPLFFSCLLIVCLLRLWCLHQPALLLVSGLVLGLGGCRFWLARCAYEQPIRPNNQVYKIQPDTIKVAGDRIQLMAQGQTDNQLLVCYYRCQSPIEKRQWQRIQQPLLLAGDIELERIARATNRNEFDYAQFMGQQKRCFYQANLMDGTVFRPIPPQGWRDRFHQLRQQALIYLRQLPPALRFHAEALLCGVRESDGQSYQNVLGQLGIIHLLSLSGLHVFYLVTIIRRLATLCRIPREWVNVSLFCLLPVYALFVGGHKHYPGHRADFITIDLRSKSFSAITLRQLELGITGQSFLAAVFIVKYGRLIELSNGLWSDLSATIRRFCNGLLVRLVKFTGVLTL